MIAEFAKDDRHNFSAALKRRPDRFGAWPATRMLQQPPRQIAGEPDAKGMRRTPLVMKTINSPDLTHFGSPSSRIAKITSFRDLSPRRARSNSSQSNNSADTPRTNNAPGFGDADGSAALAGTEAVRSLRETGFGFSGSRALIIGE